MKAIFLSLAVFAIATVCRGQDQIHAGTYSFGGSIQYSSTTYSHPTLGFDRTTFVFSPAVTYFPVNRLEIAATLGYTYTTETYENSPLPLQNSINSYFVSALVGLRYYVPVGSIAPFIGGSYGYGGPSTSILIPDSYTSLTVLEIGAEYFFSESAAFEPAVRYTNISGGVMPTKTTSFGIGVKYFLH